MRAFIYRADKLLVHNRYEDVILCEIFDISYFVIHKEPILLIWFNVCSSAEK